MGGQGVGLEGEALAELGELLCEGVCVGHRFTIALDKLAFGDGDQVSPIAEGAIRGLRTLTP